MDRVKDAMVAGNRKSVESAAQRIGVSGGEESDKGHGGHKGILNGCSEPKNDTERHLTIIPKNLRDLLCPP